MSETLHSAESDAGTAPRASSNVRHLCRLEIPGGGQIVIDGDYAFVGYQTGPDGTSILDISDPRKPKILSTINPAHPWSHSHKVRVTGDIMVVNSELQPRTGPLAEYADGGFRIYDIKDKTNPKLITFVKTHGRGCHRFDLDENYAYMSTEMEGLCRQHPGDLRHPQSVEAGRSIALVDAATARGGRRDAASARQGASAASRDAQRRQDVRRLLAFGRRHRRRQRHQPAAHAWSLSI